MSTSIFRGIIVEQVENKYRVRIPERHGLVGSANSWSDDELPLINVSTLPGVSTPYSKGDIVYVDYLDDIEPVIVGSLLGSSAKTSLSLDLKFLSASGGAKLPENTSIGNVSSTHLKSLEGVKGNIQEQFNKITNTVTPYNIEYLRSDFGEDFSHHRLLAPRGPAYFVKLLDDAGNEIEDFTSSTGRGAGDQWARLNWLGASRIENNRVGIIQGLYSRNYYQVKEYTWRPTIQGYTSKQRMSLCPPIGYACDPNTEETTPLYDTGRYPYYLNLNPDGGDVYIGRGGYFKFIDRDKKENGEFVLDSNGKPIHERKFMIGNKVISEGAGASLDIDGISFNPPSGDYNTGSIRIGNTTISTSGVDWTDESSEYHLGADGISAGDTTITDGSISVGDTTISNDQVKVGDNTLGSDGLSSNKVSLGNTTLEDNSLRFGNSASVTDTGVVVGDTKVTGDGIEAGGAVIDSGGLAVGDTKLGNGILTIDNVSVKVSDGQLKYYDSETGEWGQGLGEYVDARQTFVDNSITQFITDNSFVSTGSANSGNDSFVYAQVFNITEVDNATVYFKEASSSTTTTYSFVRIALFREFILAGTHYFYQDNSLNPALSNPIVNTSRSTSGAKTLSSFVNIAGDIYKINGDAGSFTSAQVVNTDGTFGSQITITNHILELTDVDDSSRKYRYWFNHSGAAYSVYSVTSPSENTYAKGNRLVATIYSNAFVVDGTIYSIDVNNKQVLQNGRELAELELPSVMHTTLNKRLHVATTLERGKTLNTKYAIPYLAYCETPSASNQHQYVCLGLRDDYAYDVDGGQAFKSGFLTFTVYLYISFTVNGQSRTVPVCAEQRVQMESLFAAGSNGLFLDMVSTLDLNWDMWSIHFHVKVQLETNEFDNNTDKLKINVWNVGNTIASMNMNSDNSIAFNRLTILDAGTPRPATFNMSIYYSGINIAGITASAIGTGQSDSTMEN